MRDMLMMAMWCTPGACGSTKPLRGPHRVGARAGPGAYAGHITLGLFDFDPWHPEGWDDGGCARALV
jgi:hypothetical protein